MARRRKPDDEPPPGQLWDRRPGESDPAWEAFIDYRDAVANGDTNRSIRRVAVRLGKSATLIGRWSSENDWRRRVEAWDREQDAIKQAAAVQQLEQIARRQGTQLAAAAQALLAPINAYLRKLQALSQDGADPFAGYDLRELARECREAVKLVPNLVQAERLVHGMSTSNLAGHDGGPIDVQVQAARRRARQMGRAELERMLTGELLDAESPTQN